MIRGLVVDATTSGGHHPPLRSDVGANGVGPLYSDRLATKAGSRWLRNSGRKWMGVDS